MQRIEKLVVTRPENLYGVILINKQLTFVNSKDGYWSVYEDDECVYTTAASFSMAKTWAKEYATGQGELLASGYGKNAGRRFFELPEWMQSEALEIAGFKMENDE